MRFLCQNNLLTRLTFGPAVCGSAIQSVAMSVNSTMGGEDRYEGMIVSKKNKVFRIQLNRPQRKNALTTKMFYDLASALQEAAADEDAIVAVITGMGDYYSSGNDLSNFLSSDNKVEDMEKRATAGTQPVLNLVKAFIDFPKPLIALVNGPAVGIAVTLLGLCDAVYCSDRATFHTPFTQLAQNAEGCSSYLFPRMMGAAKASEMLLFNRRITAQEALDRNLVTRVIPDHLFHKEAEALVSYVASLPPQSLQLSKQLIRNNVREFLHRVNEAEMKLVAERVQSPEVFQAVAAFFSRKNAKL